jgi:hypothetical protein
VVGTKSSQHTVIVTNTGSASLVIPANGVTVTDPTDFKISSDTCATSLTGSTVAPGHSCSFVVTFAPASIATFSATVDIFDNAAGSRRRSRSPAVESNAATERLTDRPGTLSAGSAWE